MACSEDFQRVNFQNWRAEAFQPIVDCPAADWKLSRQGFAALQTNNGQPSMFCSDFNVFDKFGGESGVTFTGEVEVLPPNDDIIECQALSKKKDDDFWGFAIGYNFGDNEFDTSESADYVLIDWKARTQGYSESCENADDNGICEPCQCDQSEVGWDEATTGLSLSRIQDLIHTDEFWSHNDCQCGERYPGVIKEYARGAVNSNVPWEFRGKRRRQGLGRYRLRFDVSDEEIRVYVDDFVNPEMVVRASDTDAHFGRPFQDGRLCFYNYSQENVKYLAFTAEENCSRPPEPGPDGKGKGGKGKGGKGKGSSSSSTGKGKGKGKGKGGRAANRRKKNQNLKFARTAGASLNDKSSSVDNIFEPRKMQEKGQE
uniref:TSP C-terminal domain-containing protein n=1 Tax=Odontella aurita TaxID=265563 RepID=A0A7S4JBE4_9STRA|mmetsp:Transcript_43144/g.131438  ORF Transcript_43144/g.131438 Transcript_43144/m.131438 type:complete len:371 (+) Transcript_43144:195-1307(+)|eukprot:CAMPEP_0113529026 /NCGR_PEP_ID=MMETSP0015_2-20120614/2166_1 /TAXON_ID=2838 /ORGANISM="Odontella" /LENGTH=370 /DNA_ID=CAMNT_0000427613 /DNA_START=194 /DNA_END=1306 /DNA_ORIENTATION=- /assembly_acc=CAM_ASM_000160